MTREEAEALKSFDHLCTCGGYAYTMNGRNPASPHMHWCPQQQQYHELKMALRFSEKSND